MTFTFSLNVTDDTDDKESTTTAATTVDVTTTAAATTVDTATTDATTVTTGSSFTGTRNSDLNMEVDGKDLEDELKDLKLMIVTAGEFRIAVRP